MSEDRLGGNAGKDVDEKILIEREKRRSPRKATCSSFEMNTEPAVIEGTGSNISRDGAYFVTCDEVPVEITIRRKDGEHRVRARIVRIDRISEGSLGVAVRFDTRLLDI